MKISRFGSWLGIVVLAGLLHFSAVAAEGLVYLAAGQPDAVALLAPPPLPDSAEQVADLAEVRAVSQTASSNELAQACAERKFNVFTFTPAVGDFFQPGKFPRTEAFFKQVQHDAAAVTDEAKDYFKRPRPFVVEPDLVKGRLAESFNYPLEKSFSYPSGHSTESMVLALILADLFPDKHDAILAEARNIGWRRVELCRHYLTDIYAGRVLAQAIVREMKASPDFQRDFAEVKVEIASRPR
jgi:acid phosphatase (class A)